MNKKILLLASAALFLLAPTFQSVLLSAGNADKKVEVTVEKSANAMMSDSDITRAVKDAFAADKAFAASVSAVDIKTDKGMVTLSGSVGSEKVKTDAVAKAKGVAGVKGVIDNIAVKADAMKK